MPYGLVRFYLISTSDEHLSAEDLALGYKQLHEIERVNRDLKHTVDVRPVYHRRGDRIKAHVLLCWLALLPIRIAENEAGESWQQLKKAFRPWLVADHKTQHGMISQANKVGPEQKRVLDALQLKLPKRYLAVPTPQNRVETHSNNATINVTRDYIDCDGVNPHSQYLPTVELQAVTR